MGWRGPTVLDAALGKQVPWINTDTAESVFGGLILVNAIVLGIDIEVGIRNGGDSGPILLWIQVVFLVAFVVELVLRILADGPAEFMCNRAGLFDGVIILASVLEYILLIPSGGSGTGDSPLAAVSVVRIFRLLRIARIVRVLKYFPELALLVSGLAASMQAVFWVFCLLVVIMYVGALICAMELGRQDDADLREFFGSIGKSFYTHFMIVTLEGYPAVAKAAGSKSPFWYAYIVCFILFSNMVLMNLVTGIVCESVVNNAKDDELASHVFEAESEKFREVLTELLKDEGFKEDEGEEITLDAFKKLIRIPEIRETLNTLDICLEIDDEDLFQIIDEDGSGSLSFSEFFQGLQRLRGSKETLHSLLVQCDLMRHSQRVRKQLQDSEDGMIQYASSLCEKLGGKLHSNLQDLRVAVDSAAAMASALPQQQRDEEECAEEEIGPWCVQQRFRLHAGEKDMITDGALIIDPGVTSSVTTAVQLLNQNKLVSKTGCVVVHSNSSRADFLVYHEAEQARAYDILARIGGSKGSDFAPATDASADAGHDVTDAHRQMLACPPCVQQVLTTAHASMSRTRVVLSQLGTELEASRARVRELEEQLRWRSIAVQTDPPLGTDIVAKHAASRDSGCCWLEDEDGAAAASSPPQGDVVQSSVDLTPKCRSRRSQSLGPTPDGRAIERRRLLEQAMEAAAPEEATASPAADRLALRRRLLERYRGHAATSPETIVPALAATAWSSGSSDEVSTAAKRRPLLARRLKRQMAASLSPRDTAQRTLWHS